MKQPRWMRKIPMKQKIEYASFGIGGAILVTAFILYVAGPEELRPLGGSLFVAGLFVSFMPYGLYVYLQDRRYRKMEKELPAFLRNLSESLKSGMSFPEGFRHASKTDYGHIDSEIQRAAHQLSWGIPFPEVMERMANRIKGSSLIRRSIYIILQSYESGGNISETLDAIAANAAKIKEAESEKKSVLMQQIYIIYAIHFLFVGIVIALYVLLTGFLLDLGGGGLSSSSALGGLSLGSVPNFCGAGSIAQPLCTMCPAFGLGPSGERVCYYQALFLLMIMIEGIFNGLVVGEVLEGKVSAGVKHSMIMGSLGFFIYVIVMTTFV